MTDQRGPHAETADAVLATVETTADGLTEAEVGRRRERHGPNELAADEGRGVASILLEQFASPLIYLLLAAAGVSLVVGHLVDAVLIVVIVAANGGFGFVQEYRAERSLEALRAMAESTVTVRRDGTERTVEATELVPGDVLVLEAGSVVPADARLLAETDLEVDESALTGESVPVEKGTDPVAADAPLAERTGVVYRGTNVTRGRAEAVVVATGMETEVGAIAARLGTTPERSTPLGRDLDRLGRRLGIGVTVLSLVLVPVLVLGGTEIAQAGLTAISLAVAAVPEGLPAVLTLTLALGVRRMADENALVRRLTAVEALGSVDVVCTDKTGTLTRGEMRVTRAWLFDETVDLSADTDGGRGSHPETGAAAESGERLERLLTAGALCNDATVEDGEPTERALVEAATRYGIDVAALREANPRRDEVPFSAERKRMATVHDDAVYVKGAPETVLERCTAVLTADGEAPLTAERRERVESALGALTGDALRVLAFARREPGGDPETDLTLLGLQGLLDPPREEVPAAVADTHRAGIAVKMITGDNPETARAIAERVGIDSEVLSGAEVAAMDDATLRERVEAVDVFARTTPEHKVRILQALQAAGHTVAMTGDGVNDAPALKHADVGIAMGVRGTDVAKGASDLVLLDDDYATIRTAIHRGRTIFDNVWKFVAYLLSANAAEVLLVVVASLFGYLILPPVQLLWINLLTDGLPALALGSDPGSEDVMDRSPRSPGAGVIDRPMLGFVVGAAVIVTAVLSVVTVDALEGAAAVTPYAMTMVFTGFVVFEFGKLYVVRWMRDTPVLSNPWLAGTVLLSFGLHLAVLYTPLQSAFGTVRLGVDDWLVLGGALLVTLPLLAAVAALARRLDSPTASEPVTADREADPEGS